MTRAALVCYSPDIAVPDAAPDNMLGQFPSYGIRRVLAAAVSDKRLPGLEITLIERRDADAVAYVDAIVPLKPDVVGFAAYVWSSLLFTEVAREVRLRLPQCRIVFGGPSAHPDVFALPCYRGAGRWIDALVIGDGEESFADILALGVTPGVLRSIPGLALPEGDAWVRTPPRPIRTDLDAIASPFQLGLMPATGVVYLETFRGCPLSCRFCQWGTDMPGAVFSRDYLERELRALSALSPGVTYLVDAGLNLNAKAFRNLAEAAEIGFFENTSLLCEVYPNRLKDAHLDFLRRCAHAHFGVGVQSLTQSALDRVERRSTVAGLRSAVAQLSGIGLIDLELILGLPGDDPDRFEDAVDEALSFGCNVRVYRCLALPDALLSRAPEGEDIVVTPETLEVVRSRSWPNDSLVRVAERLDAKVRRSGRGFIAGQWWQFVADSPEYLAAYAGPQASA